MTTESTDMSDAALIERSRWHWRAAWLVVRAAYRKAGRRWHQLHPTDREALGVVAAFVGLLSLYVPGVLIALP